MSNIIKAEYVVVSNYPIENQIKQTEQLEPTVINTPREDIYEIYNQREIILKEAAAEAQKIINSAKRNAQEEIANCKKRGYEEGYNAGVEIGKNKGYEEGYQIGKVHVEKELQKLNEIKINEINEMLLTIENKKEDIISNYEKNLTKLSIDIAEKIIRHKIDAKENIIPKIIKDVVKDYKNVDWIKIYISSKDDVITIQADKTLINELNKISKDVKIQVMTELDEGSAIVETPDGIVDASINTQLINLKEMVFNKNAI